MFVSMNWIREYVDLSGLNPEELIRRFTLSTAEVEEIIYKGQAVKGVVVGRIETVEEHPRSKKLHLLTVTTGAEVYPCVCGAPNVRPGQKVAFAMAGGELPGGPIGRAIVAGYESAGMCCSEAELGISDDGSGLMEIDDDLPLGADITDVYPIRDIVFEVDNKSLTNRPDLWGHYGIAREFAAITGRELRPLALADDADGEGAPVPVEIRRPDLAYRYSCLRMENITRRVSPAPLRIRLYYCGMRSINLLADLTNYIMLELGQPTHAFDAGKIGRIVVDTPKEDFTFSTLDGNERAIDPDTLMILNGDEPVAIAGIMGGLDSEITGQTAGVVLESANFDGTCVRKSSARLGLRTDASVRYEKVLDPELTLTAIRRFVALIRGIDPGAVVASKLSDVYPKRYPPVELSFTQEYVDRYTGIDISAERICMTLRSLGFEAREKEGVFTVRVPTWRATKDVTIKADIIEEITRIYGYDNFEIVSTRSLLAPAARAGAKREEDAIKDLLVQKFALHEVHSYIWSDGKRLGRIGIDVEDNVRILNIATPDNGTLRLSMLPTLLTFAYDNRAFSPSFGLFEVGRVVEGLTEGGNCNERRRLGIVLFDKNKTEKALYADALGLLRTLFAVVKRGVPVIEKTTPRFAWQHPKNTSTISYDGVDCGVICTLHPTNRAKIDKNAALVCIELDLDLLCGLRVGTIAYREPSKFPAIDVDLSLVVSGGQTYRDLERAWQALDIPVLGGAKVIDVYEQGAERSITIRFSFGSDERTLAMEEIQPHIDRMVAAFAGIGAHLKS